MPLELPNLDDRTYADLVEEALALIPAHAPEWTNHNPSDPGITLIELFAYLTEMLIYRLNRVTDANKLAFLKLLNRPEWEYKAKTLNQNIQDTVLRLREEQRAVTVEDFERLARAADKVKVARADCLPRWDLEARQPKAGHVSVVIVPWPSTPTQEPPLQPSEDLLKNVIKVDLERRCLITTRLHVVGPRYLKIRVQITLKINPDALEQDVHDAALKALKAYFHPLTGGAQHTGWPLGRNVYVSEIYALLDKLPEVDYVDRSLNNEKEPIEELASEYNQRRLLSKDGKQLVGVRLEPDELVDFQVDEKNIRVIRDTKNKLR